MEDNKIIELFNHRDEKAISETDKKYSSYLYVIANNVLNDHEDSRECVNDTYLRAWNTIPPNCPPKLAYYLGRITRGLSIDRLRIRTSRKRHSGYSISMEELGECFASFEDVQADIELEMLSQLLTAYLSGLDAGKRNVFIRRYYFCDSIKDISRMMELSESAVKSMLKRVRDGLKSYLEGEGFII
jgi:RNA polymerase sigma-70 factor (ECF subfamily)